MATGGTKEGLGVACPRCCCRRPPPQPDGVYTCRCGFSCVWSKAAASCGARPPPSLTDLTCFSSRALRHQVYKESNILRQLVKRAEMAGFKAIALTVDTSRLGRREADIKNRDGLRLLVMRLMSPHFNLLCNVASGTSSDLARALNVDLLLRGIEGILKRSMAFLLRPHLPFLLLKTFTSSALLSCSIAFFHIFSTVRRLVFRS